MIDPNTYLATITDNNLLSLEEKCKTAGELSMICFGQGDYTTAISMLEYALNNWKDVEIQDTPFRSKLILNLAYIYFIANDYANANKYFIQGLNFRLESIQELSKNKKQDNRFNFYINAFGGIASVNEFLISNHDTYLDFRREYFNYRIRIKNILQNDYQYFSEIYNTYSDLVDNLDSDEAYIEIVRTINSQKYGTAYLFFIVTNETINQPDLIILYNGAELENRYYRNYVNQITNRSIDTISYKIFWEQIDSKISTKNKIYISPDGIYRAINIETLKGNLVGFLSDKYSITYLNSIETIIRKRSGDMIDINSALLLGNPVFNNSHDDNVIYSPLPESGNEIEAIKNIFSNMNIECLAFSLEDATKRNFLEHIYKDLIHIATHGIVTVPTGDENLENNFLEECLVLADSGKMSIKERKEHNYIYANDIRELNLSQVQLAVLSSCVSGIGQLSSSGDLIGFPLAFFSAGCKNVLISLWEIDDTITKELIICFYENLFNTKNPLKALKISKELISNKYKHPYFWGGFILISR